MGVWARGSSAKNWNPLFISVYPTSPMISEGSPGVKGSPGASTIQKCNKTANVKV